MTWGVYRARRLRCSTATELRYHDKKRDGLHRKGRGDGKAGAAAAGGGRGGARKQGRKLQHCPELSNKTQQQH